MSKRKRKPVKGSSSSRLLPNSTYVLDKPLTKKELEAWKEGKEAEHQADVTAASRAISKAQHMAKVEAYAKAHKCTIAQAMIALMP